MSNLRRLIVLLLAGVACISLLSDVPRAQTGGAGADHTLLLVDGEVWTSGDNANGKLGVGSGPARLYRTKVVPFGAAAVAAGSEHSLVMMSDGSMYGWGLGTFGQLGVTPSATHTSPIAVPLSGITSISASTNRSFAVGPGGVVYMFGSGYLGDGTNIKIVNTPTQVPGITGVTAVSAGSQHVLLLKSDGTVLAWGGNDAGQLGDGTTTTRLTPQAVPSLTGIVQVAAGSAHSVALDENGHVFAWGSNSSGMVGDGTQITRTSPVPVTALNSLTITQIATGSSHTLARASDGTVHAWGHNGAGQIGVGTSLSMPIVTTPTFITTLPNVITKVAAARESSFAFASDGRIWGWGSNTDGELGDGTTMTRNPPTLLAEAGGSGGNWLVGVPVFSGTIPSTHGQPQTLTVTTATPGATVRYTTNGNVPTESDAVVPAGGILIDQSMTIKARAFLTGMPPSPVTTGTWLLKVNSPVAAPTGTTYGSAVNVTLSTSSSGADVRYTLDGSEPSFASPLFQTPLPIATRTTLKAKGFRAGWDASGTSTLNYYFNYGKLATPTLSPSEGTYDTDQTITMTTGLPAAQIRYTTNGSTPNDSSTLYTAPVLVSATTTLKARAFHVDWVTSDTATAVYTLQVGTPTLSLPSGAYTPGQVVTISTATPGATLRFTTTGATPTATDPMVPATGILLGNFTLKVAGFKTGYTPSPVVTASYALTGDLTARKIGARWLSSYTLSRDGLLSAFGYNSSGQLGDTTTTQRNVPGRVQGITGVVDFAAGSNHVIAVTIAGQVYAWGDGQYGRLGDGFTTQRRLPVLVGGLPSVTRVAAGASHSLAVTTSGEVYAWGYNANGRLGDGTTTDRHVPTLVPGLSDVVGVAAGDNHSLAWTSTGNVYAWGANNNGQIGNGSTTAQLTPVQIATISGVTHMAAGERHSLAVTTGGAVYAWGGNTDGRLGDGTATMRTSPVLITTLSNIVSVGAGYDHSLAVTATGAVYAWGRNADYQIGDGTQTERRSPVLLTRLSGIVGVAGGRTHSLALDDAGEVWAWGKGSYGQLGNGFSNADPGATVPTPTLPNPGTVPAPSVSPAPGTYPSAQTVTLTASAGMTIRYTLDGSEPGDRSAIYITPLTIEDTTTLKARAFQNDWTASVTTTAVYTIQQASTPIVAPPTGTYTSAQTVMMTTTTPDATIRYTLDGTEPSAGSPPYTSPFEVMTSTTVKAKAFASGVSDSPMATSVLTFHYGTLATPMVSPGGGIYGLPQTVSISSSLGASIHYTLDGSEPTQASPAYGGPIGVFADSTLKARAFQVDRSPSAVMTATYTITQQNTTPVVTITAPLANTAIADAQVDVTATVSDGGSGLATATCNGTEGTVSGHTVTCTVALVPGANTITVRAVDGAGNAGSTSVAVMRVIDPGTCEPTAGGELQITPGKLTLLGDQERGVRVVDSNGQTPENVAWSIADPAIAELVDDEGGRFVRARTPGSTCVIAAVANTFAIAPVEVVAAGAAIAGQPQWSVVPPQGTVLSLAPVSANDPEGHVAMFTADHLGSEGLTIRAVDADGLELWRRTFPNAWGTYAFHVADDHGGILVGWEKSVTRLNGQTGNEVWRYNAGQNVLIDSNHALRRDSTLFFFEYEAVTTPNSYELTVHVISLQPDTGAATRLELPVSGSTTDRVDEYSPELTQLVVLPDDTVAFGLSTHRAEQVGAGNWNATSQLSLFRIDPAGGMSMQILSQIEGPWFVYRHHITGAMLPDSHGNLLITWRAGEVPPDTFSRISLGGGVVNTTAPGWYEYEVADPHGFVYGWWADSPSGSRSLSAMDTATLTRVWTDSAVDRYLGAMIVSTLAGGGVLVKDQEGRLVKYDQGGVKTVLTDPIEEASFEASTGGLMRVTGTDRTLVLFDEPLGGAWQTSGGNTSGQQRGTNPGFQKGPKAVRRTQFVTFKLIGVSQVRNWVFDPTDSTLADIPRGDSTSDKWEGEMVTSGTVKVEALVGGEWKFYEYPITVNRRTEGWLSTPVDKSDRVGNGTDGASVPDPLPLKGQGQRILGLAWAVMKANENTAPRAVNDGGPNHAMYFAETIPIDVSKHKHIIHPGLLNELDPLFLSQWGTYNEQTNSTGWASGLAVRQMVIDHESGKEAHIVSHFNNYRAAIDKVGTSKLKDMNLLYMLERVVGLPAVFYTRWGNQIASVQTKMSAAQRVEPCMGGIDGNGFGLNSADNCKPIGKINLPPYAERPPQP